MIIEDSPEDICNRLRGIIIIPINDGMGLLDGKDTFTRNFGNQGPLNEEGAMMIERLLAGEDISWQEANSISMRLLEPDDPLGIGEKYIVPIRQKAAWLIHDLKAKLET